MNIRDFGLITDRTAKDVERVQELARKIANKVATTDEITEYLTDLKGAYNASDLNRVGRAVKYLQEKLYEVGITVKVEAKSDWEEADYNDNAAMEYYLKDIKAVHEALMSGQRLQPVPDNMNALTYDDANDIEKILLAQDESIDLMHQITTPSNVYNSAAVGYLHKDEYDVKLCDADGVPLAENLGWMLYVKEE